MAHETRKLTALGTAMVALTALPGLPAHAVTDALNMDAVIVAFSLNVTATQTLNFGAFTAPGAQTDIVINPLGPSNYNGIFQVAGSTPQPGSVLLTGLNANAPLDITILNAGAITVSNGTTAMNVHSFQIGTDAGGATRTDMTLSNAVMPVPIGATLTVNANQPAGTYSGTFTVQANYQ